MRTLVVPAAGAGTRLLPLTAAVPKELLPLVDRPALDYVLAEGVQAGLTRVIVVTRPTKRGIEEYLGAGGAGRREPLDLRFVQQEVPLGLGHAVRLAAAHTEGAPFAVALPDDILTGGCCLADMVAIAARTGRPVIAVRRVPPEEVFRYGIVTASRVGDGLYDVLDIVEKPSPAEAPSDLAVIGRYVLPPEIFGCLRRLAPGSGGELQLTDALRQLVRTRPLLAYEFPGRVLDIGTRSGYLRATVELALGHPDLGPGFAAFLSACCAGQLAATGR